MRILITGGLGFIGNALYRKLKKNHKIILLDKKKSFKKISVQCDIKKKNQLDRLNLKNIDVVIHAAAQTTVAKSFEDPENDLKSNILGTYNILNWSKNKKVKRFIFASTFNVYKEIDKKIFYNEKDLCLAHSYYGISKLSCENYVKLFCKENNIKWNILRIFNTYGSSQKYTNYHGMINIFLYMAKRKGQIIVKGHLERMRDFIHIDDVVLVIKKLLTSVKYSNETYNVGTGKKIEIKKLIFLISKVLKTKIKIIIKKETKGDFKFCCASIQKIKRDLKFKPKISLYEGLKKVNNEINETVKENFKF